MLCTYDVLCTYSVRDERNIQVPGGNDCTRLAQDKNLVSVVAVARLGADVSNAVIDTVGSIDQHIDEWERMGTD